jgi:tape measure domain-containing protein
MSDLGSMVVRIVGDITDFNKSIDAAQSRFNAATSNFQKMGANLTKFVTLPILGIGAAAVKSAADMEMQQSAFETMLGSAEAAKVMLQDLTAFAAKTPFQLPELTEASKMMLSFGIAANKIMPNIKMLGDIAQGDANKLRSLTLAFSQIQSTGRLMGQDLLQLINAGFNPLQIISEKTGKSMAELKKEMEKGAISADMVTAAFQSATSEGGRFFNGMDKASKTFNGQMSTLMDDVGALGRSFAEMLLPVLKDIVSGISGFVKQLSALDPETKKSILTFGLFAAATGPVILGILKITQMLDVLAKHPYMLVASAIIATFALLAQTVAKATSDVDKLNQALAGNTDLEILRGARAAIEQQIIGIKIAIKAMQDVGDTEGAAIGIEKLNTLLAQQHDIELKLAIAAKKVSDNQLGVAKAADTATVSFNALAPAVAHVADQYDEATARVIAWREATKELNDVFIETATLSDAAAQRAEQNAQRQMEFIQSFVTETDADRQARVEAEKKGNDAIFSSSLNLANSLIALSSAVNQQQLADLEAKYNEQIAAAADDADKKKEIDKQYQQDKAKIEYDAAMVAWGLNLAMAAANTAQGVAKAFADYAWPYSAIVAGIVGASGLAQVAAVNAAKPKPPRLAEGGIVKPRAGGVQAIVAEAGEAEAVIPLSKLDRMLAGPGGISGGNDMTHLVVNLDSRPLLDKIFDATRNKTVLISAGAVV